MTEENGEVRELPKGWCCVQHKDIAQINPKLPLNELADDLIVSFLPMAAVEEKSGRYRLSEIREYGKVKKGYTPFINGDVIFAKITPCMENGKVAVVENLQNGMGCGSTEFHVSRLTSLTSRKYLFYYLVQERFRRDARQNMTGSAGQLRVSKSYFEEFQFPLPPLLEQERIVEKIEELFSDVDQGVESLKTAQKQLKVYRQAVLKWAFEGKLTEAWRKRQSTLKTREALLTQIKAERENRYQQQLTEWEEKVREWEAIGKVGKKPTKPSKPKELKPLTEMECAELGQLPKYWLWIKLEECANAIDPQPSHRTPPKVDVGIPFISIQDFNKETGEIDFDGARKVASSVLTEHTERYSLDEGDFIIGKIGTVGKSFKLPSKRFFAISANVVLIQPFKEVTNCNFLFYLIKSHFVEKQFEEGSKATTQAAFGIQKVRLLNTPITSLTEQEKIVEEIESRLSICDQLEATIVENLQKAEALRQSILKQAFEGKLVPQAPNDEPAEKLLERIKAERQANGNTEKKAKPSHQQLTLQEL